MGPHDPAGRTVKTELTREELNHRMERKGRKSAEDDKGDALKETQQGTALPPSHVLWEAAGVANPRGPCGRLAEAFTVGL